MTSPPASLRLVAGILLLGFLALRVGTGPFEQAAAALTPALVVLALVVTAITTLCSAWRWRVVARATGGELEATTAVAAYYRSQVVNIALPGGVLGDVHRGVELRALRSVIYERTAGQVVQVGLTALAVLVCVSRLRWAAVLALAVLAIVALATGHRLSARVALPVVVASTVAALGHAALFVAAARSTGVHTGLAQLFALALVVMLGAALPLGIAGFGPREGVAAWAFSLAGLGASAGLATSLLFGLLAVIGVLPGLAFVITGVHRTQHGAREVVGV